MPNEDVRLAVLEEKLRVITLLVETLSVEQHKLRMERARLTGGAAALGVILTIIGSGVVFLLDKVWK